LPASDVQAILAQIQAVTANSRKSGNGGGHVVEPANSKRATTASATKTTTAPSPNVKAKPSSTAASFYSAFS
jgi:hypothetical protein